MRVPDAVHESTQVREDVAVDGDAAAPRPRRAQPAEDRIRGHDDDEDIERLHIGTRNRRPTLQVI